MTMGNKTKRVLPSDLEQLSDQKLFRTRLCDLALNVSDLPLSDELRPILQTLRKRGLLLNPVFYLSTDWFCADESAEIAIPFFLCHPRLRQLEQQMMGAAEGAARRQFIRIIKHELGHAFDNAFRLRLSLERIKTFGSSKKVYPFDYDFRLYRSEFVRNIGSGYAQSHPDEDFAETFAVWMGIKRDWKRQYRNTKALDKLLVMDKLMLSLKNKRPKKTKSLRLDALERQTMTLGEYYHQKKRYYRSDRYKMFDCWIERNFTSNQTRKKHRAKEFRGDLQKTDIQRQVRVYLKKELNIPYYKLDPLIEGIFGRFQNLGRVESSFKDLAQGSKCRSQLLKQTKAYFEKGLDRVIL